MTRKGERYRNRYTDKVVTVKAIESFRFGPGERRKDIVILEDGARWEAGEAVSPSPQFGACHDLVG